MTTHMLGWRIRITGIAKRMLVRNPKNKWFALSLLQLASDLGAVQLLEELKFIVRAYRLSVRKMARQRYSSFLQLTKQMLNSF